MKKVKAFLYILKRSIAYPEYYKELLKMDFMFSKKYFLSLAVIAGFTIAINETILLTPEINTTINNLSQKLVESFPRDLVIKSSENNWEINKEEPLFVEFPQDETLVNEANPEARLPKYLIVLDHEGTVEDIEKHDSLLLVNSKNVIAKDPNSGIKAYPLQNLPEGEFNYDAFTYFINNLKGIAKYLPIALFLFISIYALFYFIVFRAISTLVVGLVMFIGSKMLSLKISYLDALKIAIHTMTVPLVLELVFIIMDVYIPFTLWFFASNVLLGSSILVYLYKDNQKSRN